MVEAVQINSKAFFGSSLQTMHSCKLIFSSLSEAEPKFTPARFGLHEPLRDHFDIEKIFAVWHDPPVFWRSKSPKNAGSYWRAGSGSTFDSVIMYAHGNNYAKSIMDVHAAWRRLFQVEFSYVHGIFNPNAYLPEYVSRIMPFNSHITWREIDQGMPCVPWQMTLGPNLIERVGRDVLIEAPVYAVEERGECISLRVTESITDLADYNKYRPIRDRVVDHFGGGFIKPVEPEFRSPKSHLA